MLRIAASGSEYVGALETNRPDYHDLSINLTGQRQPDGAVLFTGRRGAIPSDAFVAEVRKLLVKLDPVTGLSGEIDLRRVHATSRVSLEGAVRTASYESFAETEMRGLSGRWSGIALITACSGYCPVFQRAGTDIEVALVLAQGGEALGGQAQISDSVGCNSCWLPIAGTWSDAALSFTSPRVVGSFATLHLQTFAGSLDRLGRIRGDFTYRIEARKQNPPEPTATRLEARIRWLKRDR